MLGDHAQELESAAVGRGVELKIHGPHLVGMFGPVTPHRSVRRPGPLVFSGGRQLQGFLSPEPLHPLVVHAPALRPQQAVGHPPATADVLSSDLPEAAPELDLLQSDDFAAVALCTAVLAHHSADKTFRCPVTLLQNRDGSAATHRAQKFPSSRSLRMAFSSSGSARSFLSRAFSFSS